ncbi:serine hydrolase [Desulfonema ishimotonii]|uniref:Serine hydrolase n=1 Tax=Desulfonema ishimotonii TaxID=45657 RepID=A0A401G4C4_9BACT|nr:serine hydrolase domain-containing protein [Desulfonema ishimotonii]GBC64070.1 serine hydrolase [Desulfonema ishimotonii]
MLKQAHRQMREGAARGVFPGGVLLVSQKGRVRLFEAYGYASLFSRRRMTRDTVFDLASLTKPLATTLAVMTLTEAGGLSLSQRLDTLLPEARKTDKGAIRVEQLLGHTSGLPAFRPYYFRIGPLPCPLRKQHLRGLLIREPLAYRSGQRTVYSDLGFMMLEWVIERVAGKPLDRFLRDQIYGPLGLEHLFFTDGEAGVPVRAEQVAATEWCPWRGRLLQGVVHDGNAYAVNGVQGHAGLFGTAENVFRLLAELLAICLGNAPRALFRQETLLRFWAPYRNSGRSLGFDRPSDIGASCGRFFSEKTVGHLGFTGTSFWIDPEREVIVVLLTNRIHPSRNNLRIRSFRPELHDAVMAEILGK